MHSFLSCKLKTSLRNFPICILSGENDKSLSRSCNFSECLTLTLRKYPISLSSIQILLKSSLLNDNVFLTLLELRTDSICDIDYRHKLFKSQYITFDNSFFYHNLPSI